MVASDRGMARESAKPGDASATEAVAWLQAHGMLSDEALARAVRAADASGERLDRALTRLGLVGERQMATAYAALLGTDVVAPEEYPALPVLVEELRAPFLRSAGMVPIDVDSSRVVIAAADPADKATQEAVALTVGRRVEVRVGVRQEIDAAIDRLYESTGGGVRTLRDTVAPDVERLREQSSEAAAIRALNRLIADAVASRASDIHLEPFDDRLSARLRVDGVLKAWPFPRDVPFEALVSRLKIVAGMNVAEHRLPQDGRALVTVEGRRVDIRVSLLPTLYGESAVLRILDRDRAPLSLDGLGLSHDVREKMAAWVRRAHGIVLACGPTGSGKTTSLYAALSLIDRAPVKVVTVEDPVEYQLDGVNQIPVRSDIGLGFATILRSILRHDPDILLVGEIRDPETAQIAIQSALTGHLVLSSLHTNDAPGAVARLREMGVEPYLISSCVAGVVAQRLVRTLCPHCRVPDEAATDFLETQGYTDAAAYGPAGCAECSGMGFAGRTAIAEALPITDAIEGLVLANADVGALRAAARSEGMRPMRSDGFDKVAQGSTSLTEIYRVTGE